MDQTEFFFLACLRDARIAPHAAGSLPAWLWSADGERILFTNAAGAAIFGAGDVADVLQKRFDSSQVSATQIARLSPSLKHDAAPRLEKLRGFGASFGRALLCACSRISVGERYGILVVAAEPAGPNLPFAERIRRLIAGCETPLAAFSTDGALILANENAGSVLAGRASLSDIRNSGDVAIETVGDGSNAFILARFADAKSISPKSAPAPQDIADLAPIAQALAEKGAIEIPAQKPAEKRSAITPEQDDIRPQMQNPAPALAGVDSDR
ncbi:MAG: hypothetical protein ABUL48_01390, partial [Pseudorhodoplanes sp.]